MKVEESCFVSLSGTTLSGIMWLEDVTSIIGLISAIVSAIFGIVSIIILVRQKIKEKADRNDLTPKDIIEEIMKGKKEADPFINQIKEALDDYQKSNRKED